MPLAITDQRKSIFFVHVPKAGGTTVERYLEQRFGPLSVIDRSKHLGQVRTGLISPATHLSAHDLEQFVPHNVDLFFAVVREPLERLKSEYRYQRGVSRLSRLPFSRWASIMIRAAKVDPRVYENHIRPQSQMVPYSAEVFYLDAEGLAAAVQRIDTVVGAPRPDLAIEAVNRGADTDIVVHRRDIEAVTDYYSEDYARFGFPRLDARKYASRPADLACAPFDWLAAHLLVWWQRHRWSR